MTTYSRNTWLWIMGITFVLGLTYAAQSRQIEAPDPAARIEDPTPGNLAPDFTLTTAEGEVITLSELRGRPVVLNFWATWCGPCRIETPFLQAVSQQHGDDLIVIGINQRESAAGINQFAIEYGLSYPLPLDTNGQINDRYRIFGLPTTFFINDEGVIVSIAPGTVTQAYLDNQVDQLLNP